MVLGERERSRLVFPTLNSRRARRPRAGVEKLEVGLARQAPIPVYLELLGLVSAEIKAGSYRPHQQLPSESVLCEAFRISRVTIRGAIDSLMR